MFSGLLIASLWCQGVMLVITERLVKHSRMISRYVEKLVCMVVHILKRSVDSLGKDPL